MFYKLEDHISLVKYYRVSEALKELQAEQAELQSKLRKIESKIYSTELKLAEYLEEVRTVLEKKP